MSFLSSAFKNFFITFAVCLLVFGFLGFQYAYPWLNEVANLSDMGKNFETSGSEVSGETSGETSDETSEMPSENQINKDGDVFTALVMIVDSNGRAVDMVFIDANGKTSQYIYCKISPSLKIVNDVGVTGPIGDLFCTMSPEAICDSITALTGIETKYCLKFQREDLPLVASLIPGASYVLGEEITLVNPKYAETEFDEETPLPEDYNIKIANVDGKVLLNEKVEGKSKLEWILSYNPNLNGSEYNLYYSLIAKSLIRQFFNNEASTMSTEVMSKLLAVCDTNLTVDKATSHLSTIFAYDNYTLHELNCPTYWESAVEKLRELDGSYD